MTTTIVHISDTHFGEYGTGRPHKDDLDILGRAIDHAKESRVDAIVHTGDLFHRYNPSQTVVEDVADALDPIHRHVHGSDDYYIPFYYIRGEHDIDPKTAATPGLDSLTKIQYVKRLWPPTVETVGANNEVALLGVPAHMNPHFASDSDQILPFRLHKNCEFVIACAHFILSDATTGAYIPGDRYAAHNVLNTIEVCGSPSTASVGINLLACGGLHSHIDIPHIPLTGTRIVYAGSLTDRYKGSEQDGYGAKYQIDDNQCDVIKLDREDRD